MFEREAGSLVRFILEAVGEPAVYYHEVPQGAVRPAVYFRPPDISSGGGTFSSFAVKCELAVSFYHVDSAGAEKMARLAADAIFEARCLVPLADEKGMLGGEFFRVSEPTLSKAGEAEFRMNIGFISHRPHDAERFSPGEMVRRFWLEFNNRV